MVICLDVKRTVFIASGLLFQCAQLTKTVHTARLGLEFCGCLGSLMNLYILVCLFHLGELSHFLLCFGGGVTNFNEPPSSYCE